MRLLSGAWKILVGIKDGLVLLLLLLFFGLLYAALTSSPNPVVPWDGRAPSQSRMGDLSNSPEQINPLRRTHGLCETNPPRTGSREYRCHALGKRRAPD